MLVRGYKRAIAVFQSGATFTALIKINTEERYSILSLIGYGGRSESSGNFQYDLEGITSVKQLIDLLLAKVE